MTALRNAAVSFLAALVLAAMVASPAVADSLSFTEEPGQPALSGKLHGEEEYGAVHCQPIAEGFIGETPKGGAPGVIVVKPGERWQLAAPSGGECEAIYEFLTE